MMDTPEYIKDLQLNIWLSKTPEQRLHQTLVDNEDLLKFWEILKSGNEKKDFITEKE